jgi:tRNA acetyltransferase TAN1
MPKRGNTEARQINPGDVGIWATCAMKKEAPTVADLRDLFSVVCSYQTRERAAVFGRKCQLIGSQYATKLYGEQIANGTVEDDDSDAGGDIEAEINKELADIRKPTVKPLFQSVKLDTQCCKRTIQYPSASG